MSLRITVGLAGKTFIADCSVAPVLSFVLVVPDGIILCKVTMS